MINFVLNLHLLLIIILTVIVFASPYNKYFIRRLTVFLLILDVAKYLYYCDINILKYAIIFIILSVICTVIWSIVHINNRGRK